MYLVRSREITVNELSGCDYPVEQTTPVCPSAANILQTFTVISGYPWMICGIWHTNVTNKHLSNVVDLFSRGVKALTVCTHEVLGGLLNFLLDANGSCSTTFRPIKNIVGMFEWFKMRY